jgi:hypothetical protein
MLAAAAALALAAAACSSTSDAGAPAVSAAPTTAAPVPSTTGATGGAATAVPATTEASGGSTGGATPAAGQACPVTVATLTAAMRADKNGGGRLAKGATLGEPECHAGYVLVVQTSVKDANGNPVADDEIARFKYESGGWRFQGASTADFCAGMPAATAEYFASHFTSGCGG